ncbi:hypothetical protein [Actinomadura sediminis]|uniref:Uncharacterized protein n=1 Tax=Actinomadura sediminis TaxID=1038904 RepID=A0ABW3EWC9_9ACTN
MADLRLAAVLGGLCRSACGALGCTAAAGVISIGAPATTEATAPGEPRPRRQVPAVDRVAFTGVHEDDHRGDRLPVRPRPPAGAPQRPSRPRDHGGPGQPGSPTELPSAHANAASTPGDNSSGPPTPRPAEEPARPHRTGLVATARTAQRERPGPAQPPTPGYDRAAFRHQPGTPDPLAAMNAMPGEHLADPQASTPRPDRHSPPPAARSEAGTTAVATALLLSLFPIVAAAICYPLRRRAAAPQRPEPSPRTVVPYSPPLDPFAIGAVGLAGPGALATARVMALAALGTRPPSLVVIPRPDVTRMFGLDEDEFLDDDIAELFIPGNLDAALAYLETELAIRRNTAKAPGPRLLLIADCAGETDRIHALLDVHRGGVSAILLGPWTGDRATVAAGGLVTAPPAETVLPARLPTMSKAQANELLYAAATPPPVRRRPSRRSAARRA